MYASAVKTNVISGSAPTALTAMDNAMSSLANRIDEAHHAFEQLNMRLEASVLIPKTPRPAAGAGDEQKASTEPEASTTVYRLRMLSQQIEALVNRMNDSLGRLEA